MFARDNDNIVTDRFLVLSALIMQPQIFYISAEFLQGNEEHFTLLQQPR